MLVKTVHRDCPHNLCRGINLKQGQWVIPSTEIDGVQLEAYHFWDLQLKDLISTCSITLNVVQGLLTPWPSQQAKQF